jgi:hypothetical protein
MTGEVRLKAKDTILALCPKVRAALHVPATTAVWLRLGAADCEGGTTVDLVTDDARLRTCAVFGRDPVARDASIRVTMLDEKLLGRVVAHVARGSSLRLGESDDMAQSGLARPAAETLGLWDSWARQAAVWIELRPDDAPATISPLQQFLLSDQPFDVATRTTTADRVEIELAAWSSYPPSVTAGMRDWFGPFNDRAWQSLVSKKAPRGPHSYRGPAGHLRRRLQEKLPSWCEWEHITVAAAIPPAVPHLVDPRWVAVHFSQFRPAGKKAARMQLAAEHAAVEKVVAGQPLDDSELSDYLTCWLVEKLGDMARIALLPVDIRFV